MTALTTRSANARDVELFGHGGFTPVPGRAKPKALLMWRGEAVAHGRLDFAGLVGTVPTVVIDDQAFEFHGPSVRHAFLASEVGRD